MCQSYKIDLTGKKFGRLTVLEWDKERSVNCRASNFWFCKCECGTVKSINTCQLRSGNTVTCGNHRDRLGINYSMSLAYKRYIHTNYNKFILEV